MIPVYLETGTRRVFACSLDWPGWCRSGKDEERALAALAAAAPRYAVVAAEAGLRFPDTASFEVVERLAGAGGTDFGVPEKHASTDGGTPTAEEAARLAALVAASWAVFDRVAAGAPAVLRKGPRGGGRDRDQIVAHVEEAEAAYARQLGLRPRDGDRRAALLDAIRAPVTGARWPVRYAARRIAWHVLDHAWEIEDKSEPA